MGRFSKKNIILAAVFLICLISFIVILVTHSGIFDTINELMDPDGKRASDYFNEKKEVTIDGEKYVPRKGVTSYLLIGIDKDGIAQSNYSFVNDEQSDFLVILVVDDKTKSYSLIHVNRDTMTGVDVLGIGGKKITTETMQIALSHTYGDAMEMSCVNTVKAVSSLFFGLPIEYYASIRFDAVPILNDYVGGVTLTIPEDMTEMNEKYVKGAVVTLNGKDALQYVRSRAGVGDQTNVSRMERQRTYMDAFMSAVMKKGYEDESFAVTYADVSPYTVTNFNVNGASKLFDKLETYTYGGIKTIDGEVGYDKDDHACFYADHESLKKIAIGLLCDKK